MKQKLLWGAILFLNMSLLVFSSCSDNDDEGPAKPTIQISELGSGHDSPNDKTAIIGTDAHIEAEIVAEGLIKEIEVEIHQVDGSYEFGKVYTDSKYIGNKNATFHEHLDIPSDAPAGKYHLHLLVVDQFGQTASAESDLTLKEAEVSITIDGFAFGAGHDFPDNKTGYIGTAPVVTAASIKAENGIEKVFVEMHSEGEVAAFELDTTYVCAGETELNDFHKHILIPDNAPAGDYHLHFKVYDKNGKSVEKSMDIEIKETGIAISALEIGNNNSAIASNIHTEFNVNAADPLKSIRIRIYKPETPAIYVLNETYTDEFATGDVKEYIFHKHMKATGATAGEYVIEIRINDTKGASKTVKDKLTITGA
jgi:hypothetical protein